MTLLLALQEATAAAPAYTATEVLTFFAAAGVLITGVGAVIVNIIVALRQGAKLDTALAKTADLSHQVQEVHTLTNSNLSAVKSELSTATAQILALRELVTDLKAQRGKAEVASALATPAPASRSQDTRAGDHAAVEKLEQIEQHTKATVEVLKDQAKE